MVLTASPEVNMVKLLTTPAPGSGGSDDTRPNLILPLKKVSPRVCCRNPCRAFLLCGLETSGSAQCVQIAVC